MGIAEVDISADELWAPEAPIPKYAWVPVMLKEKHKGDVQVQVVCSAGPANELNEAKLEYMAAQGLLSMSVAEVVQLQADNSQLVAAAGGSISRLRPVVEVELGLQAWVTGRNLQVQHDETDADRGVWVPVNCLCRAWIRDDMSAYMVRVSLFHASNTDCNDHKALKLIARGMLPLSELLQSNSVPTEADGAPAVALEVPLFRTEHRAARLTDKDAASVVKLFGSAGAEQLPSAHVTEDLSGAEHVRPVASATAGHTDVAAASATAVRRAAAKARVQETAKLQGEASAASAAASPAAETPKTGATEYKRIDAAHLGGDLAAGAGAQPIIAFARIAAEYQTKADVERWFFTSIMQEFDADGSGKLNATEFAAVLAALGRASHGEGLSSDEVARLFRRLDTSGDERLDEVELLNYFRSAEFQSKPLGYSLLNFIADGQTGARGVVMDLYDTVQPLGETRTGADVALIREGGRTTTSLTKLSVFDATTGLLVQEHIPGYVKIALDLLYKEHLVADNPVVRRLLRAMSMREGVRMNSAESARDIPSFVASYNLNTDEIEKPISEYATFNEFFARKLKPGMRPVASPDDGSVAVSPADCRMTVFPTLQAAASIWVKGSKFTVEHVFGSHPEAAEAARMFVGGSLAIARLAPQDIHRFYSPVQGRVHSITPMNGALFTVNPLAIRSPINVYTENKRVLVLIDTEDFGMVAAVVVGATIVGSIEMTKEVGDTVEKGEELGLFYFGGSTVLLFFQPGRIEFNADLVERTTKPIETLVRIGMGMGKAAARSPTSAAAGQ